MSLPNLTVSELEQAGMPAAQKSAIRRWYEGIKSGSNMAARAKLHAAAAGQGLRQGGESLLVGGILGAVHVQNKNGGLDVRLGKSDTAPKLPLDAAVGVLGLLGGAAMAHEEFGKDLANAGSAGLAIFSFRKTYELLAEKKVKKGEQPGGGFVRAHGEYSPEFGAEDPIIAAARFL